MVKGQGKGEDDFCYEGWWGRGGAGLEVHSAAPTIFWIGEQVAVVVVTDCVVVG